MAELTLKISADDDASAVVEAIETSFSDSLEAISSNVESLEGTFKEAADAIVAEMKGAGEKIADALSSSSSVSGIAGGPVGVIAGTLLSGLQSVGKVVFSAMSTVASAVWSGLKAVPGIVFGVFSTAFGAIKGIASTALSAAGSVIGASFSGLGSLLDTVVLTPFRLVFNKVTALAGGVGLAWGTKVAADVQDSLSVALALIPDQVTPALRTGMLRDLEDLRAEIGASGELIGSTMYNAVSAGAKDDPVPLTRAALMFATIGGQVESAEGSLALFAQTANALSKDLSEATDIADLYQKTIQEGLLKPQELTMQMGRVLPFVQDLKLEMADLLGVIAQGSQTFRAEQLFTGLQGMLARVMDPGFIKNLKEEIGVELYDLQGQFVGTSELISRIAEAAPSDAVLKKLFPSVEAQKFFRSLSGQLTETNATIAEMANFAGAIEAAWAERSRSVQLQTTRVTGSIANLFSEAFEVVEDDLAEMGEYAAAVLGNVVANFRELKDEGKLDELKESAAETWGVFKGWLPTMEQLGVGFHTVLTSGVSAFSLVKGEFFVFKDAFLTFFQGGDVDLSQSNLILGGQIAFEYLKKYAAEAVDYGKEALSNMLDSPVVSAITEKAGILGEMLVVKFQAAGARIKIALKESFVNAWQDSGEWAAETFSPKFVRDIIGYDETKSAQRAGLDTMFATQRYGVGLAESAQMGGLSGRLSKPFPVSVGGFDPSNLEALQREFSDRLGAIQRDAEEKAEAIEAAIGRIGGPAVSAAKDVLTVPGEGKAPEVEAVDEGRRQAQEALASQNQKMAEMRDSVRDMAAEQVEYVTENGKLSEEILQTLQELQDAIRLEYSKLRELREALAR